MKALVLSTHVFSEFTNSLFDAGEISWLWEHSFAASLCAQAIGALEGLSPLAVDDASTAGLLHNCGKLVLASSLGHEYKMALEMVAKTGITLIEAEEEVLGCNHAQVGAYLLGLWGLSDSIVEAVAWHLNPLGAPGVKDLLDGGSAASISPLTAVHAACAYHNETTPSRLSSGVMINRLYLQSIGCGQRVPIWNQTCAEVLRRGHKR